MWMLPLALKVEVGDGGKSGSWQAGELRTEFEEPFESLRRSNQLSKTKHEAMAAGQADFQDWLPTLDSNPRFLPAA